MIFEIHQVKSGPETRDIRFEDLPEGVHEVDLSKYDSVFKGDLNGARDEIDALNRLFYIFNMEHPENYRGRSMSLSDVIKVEDKYYFCCRAGWKQVNVKNIRRTGKDEQTGQCFCWEVTQRS